MIIDEGLLAKKIDCKRWLIDEESWMTEKVDLLMSLTFDFWDQCINGHMDWKALVAIMTENVCIPDKRFEYEYCTVFLLQ